jgi:hypothetical protein
VDCLALDGVTDVVLMFHVVPNVVLFPNVVLLLNVVLLFNILLLSDVVLLCDVFSDVRVTLGSGHDASRTLL